MNLSDEQRQQLQEQVAAYEMRRDQLLAEANIAQGAALALRGLLAPPVAPMGGEPAAPEAPQGV